MVVRTFLVEFPPSCTRFSRECSSYSSRLFSMWLFFTGFCTYTYAYICVVLRTIFVSFLCGHYVVIMWTYVAFFWAGLSLCSMKNITLVPAGISGSHPCASRETSCIFALSHSCHSLIMSTDFNSDFLCVSLLVISSSKCNQGGVYMCLGWEIEKCSRQCIRIWWRGELRWGNMEWMLCMSRREK